MASFRPVHFEIPGDDPEKLTTFYRDLFGWKFQKTPNPILEYWLCETGEGPGINGAIIQRKAKGHQLINYINVDSIDAMMTKLQNLGGSIMVPKSPVQNMGWFCVGQDPQGNQLGFWQDDKNAR